MSADFIYIKKMPKKSKKFGHLIKDGKYCFKYVFSEIQYMGNI